MDGDKLVRRTGYAAVAAVSGVAAWISYWHAVAVVGKHGEAGTSGHLYPATIDGLIVAASMVLLDSARNREKPPRLAWWLVGAGIVSTLAANVLDGVAFGILGSIIAAWPAAAFVGAYEMIMVLIRAGGRRKAAAEAKLAANDTAQVNGALDAPARELPRLRELVETRPPWEPAVGDSAPWDTGTFFAHGKTAPEPEPDLEPEPPRGAAWAEVKDATASPMVPRHAAPPPFEIPNHFIAPQPETDPLSHLGGTVTVRNPMSRAERKIPFDERAARTGTIPAITD